jgi:hypothetical protein
MDFSKLFSEYGLNGLIMGVLFFFFWRWSVWIMKWINANDDGALTNPSVDANDYINWHTTSISGTPTSVTVTMDYTVN